MSVYLVIFLCSVVCFLGGVFFAFLGVHNAEPKSPWRFRFFALAILLFFSANILTGFGAFAGGYNQAKGKCREVIQEIFGLHSFRT